MEEVWNWLRGALPEWKLPEPEPEKPAEGEAEKEGTALVSYHFDKHTTKSSPS
jgi:hypothetical protein